MNRNVAIKLNKVSPVPVGLRSNPAMDAPAASTQINLGRLFHHYWMDSFPTAPPKPDPSRFEYAELVSSHQDFKFHAFVDEASTVKKRALSTELGQAFCRSVLHDHFSIYYFAHMQDVLGKSTHAAFEGLRIERLLAGDVPDYLCARTVTQPYIAEAKGRFTSIGFNTAEFEGWRSQFGRIRALDRNGLSRRLKGFVVGTRFATERNRSVMTTLSIEDPETPGEAEWREDDARALGRVVLAMHYGRVYRKLGLLPIASALENGYSLPRELSFVASVWTCMVPPLAGREFVGGFYRTTGGAIPELTERGWQMPWGLGEGHAAFVGVELQTAITAASAARGEWSQLDTIEPLQAVGLWSSEFSWLRDGTVIAPFTYFLPTRNERL